MRRGCWAIGPAVVSLLGWTAAHADGLLPGHPYNYLHPPPARASTNTQPQSGVVRVSVSRGRATSGYGFTDDGQAGLALDPNSFSQIPGAQEVRIDIRPVETPAGLPAGLAADGNAYSFVAAGEPGNRAVHPALPMRVALRWPHFPTAMYVYDGGRWQRVCDSNHWTITPSTVVCLTHRLGVFLAVATARGGRSGTSTTPRATPPASSSFPTWAVVVTAIAVCELAGLVVVLVRLSEPPARGT